MKTKLILLALIAIFSVSCKNRTANQTENVNLDNDMEEIGSIVNVVSCNDTTLIGYILFALDSSTVEVSLPETTVTLDRRIRDNGTPVWNVEDDDTYVVEMKDNKWQISRREKLLYISK